MAAELIKKLRMKSGQKALVLNAPEGYIDTFAPLPEGVLLFEEAEDEQAYDFVHLFADSVSELERLAPSALRAVIDDGLLWVAYPKGSSKIKTDLNRDNGWQVVKEKGWEGVALISIDDTWSAMRFRPSGAQDKRDRRPSVLSLAALGGVPETPPELAAVLQVNPSAASMFESLAPSHKKEYITWITGAKKEETRANRLSKAVEMLSSGRKNLWTK